MDLIKNLVLLILLTLSASIFAACPPDLTATDITFSSACDLGGGFQYDPVVGGGTITIDTGVSLTGPSSYPFETYKSGNVINRGTMPSGYGSIMVYENFGQILNQGTISRGTYYGAIGTWGRPTITEITNTGLIETGTSTRTLSGVTFTIPGIYNFGGECCTDGSPPRGTAGTITTLNNLQGGDTPLTYLGKIPTNYNIIINSTSAYGKFSVVGGTLSSGSTTFGIYAGSTVSAGRYASVITGLSAGNFSGATLGTYGSYNWILDNVSGTTWDLVFTSTGPSASDTQSSLTRLASRLRSSYNSASLISNFPNSNTYDCNLFDVKGMCISAGGRYSTVDNPSSNSTAAVVTLGYKVSPSIRIGGFLDQSVNNNAPTGVHLSNSNPMMGAFLYWNQQPDGLGYQVKIANAYQDKDLSTTRDVIGTSEAGTGKTSLTTQSYVGELSYAFMYKENTLVRPYFALRHTKIEQDAYTETGVTSPLTYSALNDRTTSALMGVKFKHALTPKANLTGSLGLEQDLHHKTDQLSATGVSGLTSENFSGDIHRTRPVASIGATYDIAKTQRLSGEVLVQQLPFQSTTGATAYFNYMIGF
jgi:hypothetical protein